MLYNHLEKLKIMVHIDYNSTLKMYGYLVIVFVNILLLIGQTTSIIESLDDIVKTSSSLATYGIKLQAIYKLFFLYWDKKRIIKMHHYLEEHFWDTNVAGRTVEKDLNKRFRLIIIFLGSYFGMVMFVYIWFCLFPLVMYPPEIRVLPLQISLPFDTNPSPLHEILYISLCASGTGNVFLILLFDFLFLYFCQHLLVQLKLLQTVLTDFSDDIYDLSDGDIIRNKAIQETLYRRLNCYIVHHIILLQFGDELKSFSSIAITIQVTVSMLSLITLGFGITKEDHHFTALQMMLLFNCMFVEIILYGLHGSELEHQSQSVSQAVYKSKWYLLHPQFRKNVFFLQMNAQKEMAISAAGCAVINNMTLIQMCRAVFSAITLLQSLDEE